jgi:hypothetical protein
LPEWSGDAINARDHGLAVDDKLLAMVLERGFGDPREALGQS